jgi:hypothetical protein
MHILIVRFKGVLFFTNGAGIKKFPHRLLDKGF